jgi:hypothetical protein
VEPPAFVAAGVIVHASGEDVQVMITCVSELSTLMDVEFRIVLRDDRSLQVRLDNIIGPLMRE